MPRKPTLEEFATVRVSHHALASDRADTIRRRPGPPSRRPECLVIGHAWTDDPAREGGKICLVCEIVRLP